MERLNVDTNTSYDNHTESDYHSRHVYNALSPGLPKSPRPNFTPETASSMRRPVLTDNGVNSRQRSSTPTSRRQPSPIMNLKSDSRDDSQYEGSIGQSTINSAVYLTPPSPSSTKADDMDDVLIHRYLSEKNKVRAAEAKNTTLHSHIDELNRHIDEQAAQAEKDRAISETKIFEQEKMACSLENAIKDLRDQMSKLSSDNEKQTNSLRAETERMVKAARKEGNKAIKALKSELTDVQAKYSESQQMLTEEKDKLSQMTAKCIELQNRHDQEAHMFEDQLKETDALKYRIDEMEGEMERAKTYSDEEVARLKNALDNLNEMLDFQNSKGIELSAELKNMSCQYVQSMEKLGQEISKTESLRKELDTVEGKLKIQLKQNAVVANQLEEMARGYIETDELLKQENSNVNELKMKLTMINKELAEERSKSNEFATSLENAEKSFKEAFDENLKLSGIASSLTTELSSAKKTLAKSLSKVKSLSKKYKESQAMCAQLESHWAKERERVFVLETELDEKNEKHKKALSGLADANKKLDEKSKACSTLSTQLKNKATAFDKIDATLQEERAAYETVIAGKTAKIVSLSKQVNHLEKEYSMQKTAVSTLKASLDATKEQCDHLNTVVKDMTEDSLKLKQTYDTEREEFREKSNEQEESILSLTDELRSLETKHAALFDNLVETESKLHMAKESLEDIKLNLEKKQAEFDPTEKMLKEEISVKDEALKSGEEKSRKLSSQLVQMNEKNKVMHCALAETEERVIKAEEQSRCLQNQFIECQRKCKKLSLSLERERNGPAQRKLKVAKRMIRAEKDRYLAVLKEIEAKNVIIGRIENQSEAYKKELAATKKELDNEKEKKSTHSGKVLQDLHKQLEDERKKVKQEKEQLRTILKSERSKVKSLTMRLSVAEGSSEKSEVLEALKEQHETSEQVLVMTEKNKELHAIVQEKREIELMLKNQISSMESKMKEIVHSMDTMAQYCSGLEEERRILRLSLERAQDSTNGVLDGTENVDGSDGYDEDEDTLDGRSLSDFSIAQIPAPRQTHRELLKKRTAVSKADTDGEKIELMVDTRHLYD